MNVFLHEPIPLSYIYEVFFRDLSIDGVVHWLTIFDYLASGHNI